FIGKSQCGLRGAQIAELDWSVGRIFQTLRELHLEQNTLVLFSSDNGPILDDGYKDGSVQDAHGHQPAGPWRGGKYQIYEGGTRVPLITWWRGRIQPGESAALIGQVDLLASLAKVAEARSQPEAGPDSVDLSDALISAAAKGRTSLIEQSAGVLAIREGDW